MVFGSGDPLDVGWLPVQKVRCLVVRPEAAKRSVSINNAKWNVWSATRDVENRVWWSIKGRPSN